MTHFYYTAEFRSLETFWKKTKPPCYGCLVAATCIDTHVTTRMGYVIMKINKPCKDFDDFISKSEYNKVFHKFVPKDPKKPYGYGNKLWGYNK
jgi:hypothetical protein